MSKEWVEEYVKKLNANPAYKEAAATWEGDFFFVVRDDKDKKKILKAAYFDLWHGKCREAFEVEDMESSEKKPEFVFDGPLKNWIMVVKKQLDPIQGLMTGKFKLTGNMQKVMRAVKAAQELVNTATTVETEFPE